MKKCLKVQCNQAALKEVITEVASSLGCGINEVRMTTIAFNCIVVNK